MGSTLSQRLARLCFESKLYGFAFVLCKTILKADPECLDALEVLGLIYAAEGYGNESASVLERCVANRTDIANGYHNLGAAYLLAQQWPKAIRAFTECIRLDPAHREARVTLPLALLESGEIDGGLAASGVSLAFAGDSPVLNRTRGRLFAANNRSQEAAEAFGESLRLDPENLKSVEAAGIFYLNIGEESLAMEQFQKLSGRRPGPDTWSRLTSAAMRAGNLTAAIASLRSILSANPEDARMHSALLYALISDPAQTGEDLRTEHRTWRAHTPAARKASEFINSPDPERRLRVGVLSGELNSGSGCFFLFPIFRNHDPKEVEIWGYNSAFADAETEKYGRMFFHWRDVEGLSDEKIVEIIREDEIDILLDVSGHLPRHRLAVFARRAAPVQISYPRYPATTGLNEMDYRLSDAWADPAGETDQHYTETLVRLPGGYLAYEPPECAPDVSLLPALANGFVTYGFFQTPMRLNPVVFDVLAQTLLQTPRAQLLIHYHVADFDRPGRWARRRIEEAMEQRGVDRARLQFRGPLTFEAHLALVSQTDIALDAFPYTGQTNTCECLWSGVPVVSLAGNRFSARVSPAILQRVGLGDWVAETPADYDRIAVRKASELEALARLRSSLRDRLKASGLLDGRRLAREIEAAYRLVWRRWCRMRKSSSA